MLEKMLSHSEPESEWAIQRRHERERAENARRLAATIPTIQATEDNPIQVAGKRQTRSNKNPCHPCKSVLSLSSKLTTQSSQLFAGRCERRGPRLRCRRR
jgi:hypothetical protein